MDHDLRRGLMDPAHRGKGKDVPGYDAIGKLEQRALPRHHVDLALLVDHQIAVKAAKTFNQIDKSLGAHPVIAIDHAEVLAASLLQRRVDGRSVAAVLLRDDLEDRRRALDKGLGDEGGGVGGAVVDDDDLQPAFQLGRAVACKAVLKVALDVIGRDGDGKDLGAPFGSVRLRARHRHHLCIFNRAYIREPEPRTRWISLPSAQQARAERVFKTVSPKLRTFPPREVAPGIRVKNSGSAKSERHQAMRPAWSRCARESQFLSKALMIKRP